MPMLYPSGRSSASNSALTRRSIASIALCSSRLASPNDPTCRRGTIETNYRESSGTQKGQVFSIEPKFSD